MATGRNPQIDNSIDWIKDEDENVLGYQRDPRTFVPIPRFSADGKSLVGVDGKIIPLDYFTSAPFGEFGDSISSLEDATDKLNADLEFCKSNGLTLNLVERAVYRISSLITVTLPAKIKSNGAILVADAAFSGDTAVLVTSDSTYSNGETPAFLDIAVRGPYGGPSISRPPKIPLASYKVIDGVKFETSNQLAHITAKLFVEGFRDNVVVAGSNWWLLRFDDPQIGKAWRRGWSFSRIANAGENIIIRGGVTYNCVNAGTDGASEGTSVAIYEDGTSNIGFSLYSHSIDYCDYSFDVASGAWNFFSCHLENNNNHPHGVIRKTPAMFPTSVAFIGKSPLAGQGHSGWSAPEQVGGRPAMLNTYDDVVVTTDAICQLAGYQRNTTVLIPVSGTPRIVSIKGWYERDNGVRQPIPYYGLNSLYNPNAEDDFEGWVVVGAGSSTWSIESVNPISGNKSFKIVSTAGNASWIYQDIKCKPGDLIVMNAKARLSSITSGSLKLRVKFFASNGTKQISDDVDTCGSLPSVGDATLGAQFVAPVGAWFVRIHLYAPFTGTGLFDEVELYNLSA